MASKEVADLTIRALDGTEEFHLVAGVVRDGGGNVTNHGNSRRVTSAGLAAFILAAVPPAGISQAFADGRYLQAANNLADVASVAMSRTNLSVYSKAEVDAAIAAAAGGPKLEMAVTRPRIANYALINGGGGGVVSQTDTTFGVHLVRNTGTLGNQWSLARLTSAAPAAGGFTLTARLRGTTTSLSTQQHQGLFIRNSTSGRFIVLATYNVNSELRAQAFADVGVGGGAATFAANVANATAYGCEASFPWRRIVMDGAGNISFQVSVDGETWVVLGTTTAATYLNAAGGTIDQVGFATYGVTSTLCQSLVLV